MLCQHEYIHLMPKITCFCSVNVITKLASILFVGSIAPQRFTDKIHIYAIQLQQQIITLANIYCQNENLYCHIYNIYSYNSRLSHSKIFIVRMKTYIVIFTISFMSDTFRSCVRYNFRYLILQYRYCYFYNKIFMGLVLQYDIVALIEIMLILYIFSLCDIEEI